MNKYLSDHEDDAAAFLKKKDDGKSEDLVSRTYDFMGQVLNAMPEGAVVSKALAACSLIFSRIMQDLRCTYLCASRGYTVPAGTIAASIWEMTYEIKYLILFPNAARGWFEHREIKRTFKRYDERFNKVIEEIIKDVSERDQASIVEWNNYSYLSAFKHGNSQFQQLLGIENLEDLTIIHALPDTSDFAIMSSSRIIYHACNYSILSGKFMANEFLLFVDKDRITPVLNQLIHDLQVYVDEAMPKGDQS